MSLSTMRILPALAAGCALFAATLDARAQVTPPSCATLPQPIIYGAGGSAQQVLVAEIATQLAEASTPYTVVYSDSGSACVGYNDLVTPPTTPITGTALYWNGSSPQQGSSCTLDGTETFTFAVMGNSPSLCGGVTWPNPAVGQFLGPVQPLDFVVPGGPGGSTEQSISTEAAYYIWGFFASDADHTVPPWSTPANIFTRSTSSFVSLFLSLDTSIPVARVAGTTVADAGLLGTQEKQAQNTVTALASLSGTTAASSGIGVVSGEYADLNRGSINILAYQHTGQTCGYWPDSTPQAFDKANVRSGQYWLWSPVHFFALVGDGGQISDPNTATFIGLFTGATTSPPAGVDVFNAEVAAYTVPTCAMQAGRDGDLTAPYSYAPPAPCSCKFDFAVDNANKDATCKTCSQDSDCTTNHCRNIGAPLPTLVADAGASTTPDAGTSVGYCEAY
jgi:hypothetical protein